MEIHVVLHQPVIPQNTGSIARLCACTGAHLHLIHPLGFQIDEAKLKRAGLDYWPHVSIREHSSFDAFLGDQKPENIYFLSKFAQRPYTAVRFKDPVYLVLGSETQGLPQSIHTQYADRLLQIPMRTHLVRSLNLAQAAAIVVYEALRQDGFAMIK